MGGFGPFLLSYNKALEIQAKQLDFYCNGEDPTTDERVRNEIKKNTKPCPEGIDPDKPIPVAQINELVPRGADIEYAKYGPGYGNSFQD